MSALPLRILRPGKISLLVLYGSYARGDARNDSDADVRVVLEDPPDWSDRKQAHKAMYHPWEEYGECFSTLRPPTSRHRKMV